MLSELAKIPSITKAEIREGIRRAGLLNAAVCAHCSLQSFGHVTGGADAVVDAFLEEGCTVMAPSFSWGFGVPMPEGVRYRRNGWDSEKDISPTAGVGRIYTPATTEIEKEMGALPAAIVCRAGRARGMHPLSSFTALGSLAEKLVASQRFDHVFAPLEMLAKSGGYVVLMGLNLRRMTLIHLAEKIAGRRLFRRWANDADGRVVEMEVGGHSRGFEALRPHLKRMRTKMVGESLWTIAPAQEALDEAVEAIRRNPGITHCEYPDCVQCNDLIAGGPVPEIQGRNTDERR